MAIQPVGTTGAPRLKRPMYSGKDGIHPATKGLDVRIAKYACMRYEEGLIPATKWSELTETFGPAMEEALRKVIQPQNQIKDTGNIGQATWEVLWAYLDPYRRKRYRLWKIPAVPKPPLLPDLGPLVIGDPSLLDISLTHRTSGIDHYPAVDAGWRAGRTVLAVEDMHVVFPPTSSRPGAAFYAEGKSGLSYWYGHLVFSPILGRVFHKGEPVGTIFNQGVDSHVHLGVNARGLIGFDLLYGKTGHGPDYTWGSPTIRTQLKEALSL